MLEAFASRQGPSPSSAPARIARSMHVAALGPCRPNLLPRANSCRRPPVGDDSFGSRPGTLPPLTGTGAAPKTGRTSPLRDKFLTGGGGASSVIR